MSLLFLWHIGIIANLSMPFFIFHCFSKNFLCYCSFCFGCKHWCFTRARNDLCDVSLSDVVRVLGGGGMLCMKKAIECGWKAGSLWDPAKKPKWWTYVIVYFYWGCLLSKKFLSICRKQGCNFKLCSLNFRPLCQTLSKAFETSLSTTSFFERWTCLQFTIVSWNGAKVVWVPLLLLKKRCCS